jgi:hypothetical protein
MENNDNLTQKRVVSIVSASATKEKIAESHQLMRSQALTLVRAFDPVMLRSLALSSSAFADVVPEVFDLLPKEEQDDLRHFWFARPDRWRTDASALLEDVRAGRHRCVACYDSKLFSSRAKKIHEAAIVSSSVATGRHIFVDRGFLSTTNVFDVMVDICGAGNAALFCNLWDTNVFSAALGQHHMAQLSEKSGFFEKLGQAAVGSARLDMLNVLFEKFDWIYFNGARLWNLEVPLDRAHSLLSVAAQFPRSPANFELLFARFGRRFDLINNRRIIAAIVSLPSTNNRKSSLAKDEDDSDSDNNGGFDAFADESASLELLRVLFTATNGVHGQLTMDPALFFQPLEDGNRVQSALQSAASDGRMRIVEFILRKFPAQTLDSFYGTRVANAKAIAHGIGKCIGSRLSTERPVEVDSLHSAIRFVLDSNESVFSPLKEDIGRYVFSLHSSFVVRTRRPWIDVLFELFSPSLEIVAAWFEAAMKAPRHTLVELGDYCKSSSKWLAIVEKAGDDLGSDESRDLTVCDRVFVAVFRSFRTYGHLLPVLNDVFRLQNEGSSFVPWKYEQLWRVFICKLYGTASFIRQAFFPLPSETSSSSSSSSSVIDLTADSVLSLKDEITAFHELSVIMDGMLREFSSLLREQSFFHVDGFRFHDVYEERCAVVLRDRVLPELPISHHSNTAGAKRSAQKKHSDGAKVARV